MDPIVKVEHLTKTFKSRGREDYTAVDDVNFSLYPGEKLAIIGESGSGKTTVVNMLTRLLDCTSGRILLDGEDITNVRGKALREIYRKVQMVFQTPVESFDPRRTLGDGISESLVNHGMKKKEAMQEAIRLLSLCGLEDEFAKRYPHEVSGGQCQRAAIARALAIKPKVLILDEATSSVDTRTEELVQQAMDKLTEGRTSFIIAHRLSTIRNADMILVMNEGNIIEQGNQEKLMAQNGFYADLYNSQFEVA